MIGAGVVADLNTLVDFCAQRDVGALTREAVGGDLDVAILFGGSILAGASALAIVPVTAGRGFVSA
ncbi:hypothetical protein [Actinoplanes philippinensis]|uniref:hypothetical protein n=1 Tax=Actinoplanes philippinensis TaxID=35752 RepID=UPI0033D73522